MKQNYYLYADFETTTIPFKKNGFKNSQSYIKHLGFESVKDYYENYSKAHKPEVYSWNVVYDKEYKKLGEHNHTVHNEIQDHFGISETSFLDFVENLTVDATMFFNNLKGFDGHFLIPILDKAGYTNVLPYSINDIKELSGSLKETYTNRILKLRRQVLKSKVIKEKWESLKLLSKDTANDFLYKHIEKRWNKLLPKEYSVMTDGGKHIYEIKIGIGDTKTTKGTKRNRALIIRDNLLLFPTSIANMGKTLVQEYHGKCACYKLGIHKCKDRKGKEQLEKKYLKHDLSSSYTRSDLYNSIEEFKNDGNELEYLRQDTYILWKFHKVIEKYFPRNKWGMTIGATAYQEWIQTLGGELLQQALDAGEYEEVTLKRGAIRIKDLKTDKLYDTTKIKNLLLKKILPTDWLDKKDGDETVHDILYEYYDGGITMVNEKYRGQLVENLSFLDINSSYPAQMVKNVYAPMGRGLKGDVKGYDYKFYTLVPKRKIENKHGLPFLHNRHSQQREYLKTLLPNTEYKFTTTTYERFLKYYKCSTDDYELTVDYSFKQIKIYELFKSFIDKWYEIKEQAGKDNNPVLKMIAKLFLNNLYGKFGTKSVRESVLWNQELQIWETYTQKLPSKYYLPIGIVIAELGRMNLVDAVDTNYEEFCYCDTDSIGVINYKPEKYKNVILHPSEIGKWDIEFNKGYGVFRRPKQYMLLRDAPDGADDKERIKIAFAGINFNRLSLPDEELSLVKEADKIIKTLQLTDFITGRVIENQTASYRLLGSGITINNLDKSIKPVWDYKPLSQQKYYKPEHFQKSLEKISKLSKISL